MVELILSCLITLKIVPVWEARGGGGGFKDERLFSPQKCNSRNLRKINVKKGVCLHVSSVLHVHPTWIP